jgi:hypothetical protein
LSRARVAGCAASLIAEDSRSQRLKIGSIQD